MDDLISRQDAIKAVTYGAFNSATLFGRSDAGMTALRETVRAIEGLPSADELAIVAEYCRKRNLVLITMESFRVLQAYYDRQNGMDGEHDG